MTAAEAHELEQRYQRLRESPYSSTFTYGRKKIAELMDLTLRDFPPGSRALDVGCGTGYDVHRLRERGFLVTGVEPVADLRARAREANPGVEIVDAGIEKLPFRDGSFDLVSAIEVIRYLADPAPAVAEIHRVLAPGGRAFVTAAPRFSLSGYAVVHKLVGARESFLSVGEARTLFVGAGFASVEVHGTFLAPPGGLGLLPGAVLARLLRVYEPLDDWVSDQPGVRNLSNHLVIVARK